MENAENKSLTRRRSLKAWRKKRRFTPTVLSKVLGVKSPTTVFEWEKNNRLPRKDTLKRFDELIKKEEGENAFPAIEFFVPIPRENQEKDEG
jgi:transcriptional regulator with XRE-family HTH domain